VKESLGAEETFPGLELVVQGLHAFQEKSELFVAAAPLEYHRQ
jgi:hypothetical protein